MSVVGEGDFAIVAGTARMANSDTINDDYPDHLPSS